MHRELLVISPTRNEARNVPLVVAELAGAATELARTGWGLSLLVVDDGSTDGTTAVIRSEAALRGLRVEVLEGPGQGLSRALFFAFEQSLRYDVPLVATFDFDGQHDATQLPQLVARWEATDGAGAVFGTRFAPTSVVTGVTGTRKVVSIVAQWAVRLATTGTRPPSDATTSLRVFTPAVIEDFLAEVPASRLDGYRLFSLLAVFIACRYSFAEVPIVFRPRINGESKLGVGHMVSFVTGLPRLRRSSRDWRRQQPGAPTPGG